MALGAFILVGAVSVGTAYSFYSGHAVWDKVPITNRGRLIWTSKGLDESLGFPTEKYILDQAGKLRYEENEVETILVKAIMKRLLEVDSAKGLEISIWVYEEFGNLLTAIW